MKYTILGNTGIEVSTLGLGTMAFGGAADEATSQAIFARARDAGINFFDCADVYNKGRAETILGRLISCSLEVEPEPRRSTWPIVGVSLLVKSPIEQIGHPSSTVTMRFVFLTDSITVAVSSGRSERKSISSASIPSPASTSAASKIIPTAIE